jgi:colanic acid/amylovoran biosynthesis protein
MFDQGKTDWGQKYHRMIMLSVEESLKKGFQVYFVVHDTSDQSVVKSFVDKFKEQRGVKVYQEEDPVVLKKFIGKSAYIVGSRYHGILAAFSYGVPALCMGWAHKYIYLFKEFGLEEYMLTPQTSPAELVEKISQIAAPKKNREIKTAILQKVAKLKLINQQMWDEVVEVITQ